MTDIRDNSIEAAARAMCDDELWPGAWIKTNEVEHEAWLRRARAAIAAYEAALWQPIETAPRDGGVVIVRTNSVEGLPAFATCCAYHPDAGWCVDDLRECTHWRPLPPPPGGEG